MSLGRYDLCFQARANCINQSIVSGTLPDSLKLANISPVYKAQDIASDSVSDPETCQCPASLVKDLQKIKF